MDNGKEFAEHLRDVADALESGKFNPQEWLGNDGSAERATTSPTARALARCVPTDGDPLYAADPEKLRDLADEYESATGVEKIGDVWYTEDAEYGVCDTASGSAVVRGDGSYAEFLSRAEAEEAAELLAKGDKRDSDYEWSE